MPRTSQMVKVGGREIELSNLQKVLYPADNILKAEVIGYYLKVAPAILTHAKGRPLSVVRYPDGIEGERFFQKNRPDWAPAWIRHAALGDASEEKVDYVIPTEEASLAWLANLACIEFHQMHCRAPRFDRPDYFVFDLDPPEDFRFGDLAEMALALKLHLESFGYVPFVKTTGSKGLHVLAPIEPKWTFDKVFEAARAVAAPFVEAHKKSATLHLRKESRKGRVLVDIYRNSTYQSIVSAYSLRGLPGAPVSMPVHWEQLKDLGSASDFDLHTVPGYLEANGDAWTGMTAYAAALHTMRRSSKTRRTASGQKEVRGDLRAYAGKRDFGKTPEPQPGTAGGKGDAFVLHRHHATRLHYDLRLEREGVLKSWAVPKGLPQRPGIKRLAVQTEDHPMEYLDFEGAIPKGQYGGGKVWLFARGRYDITKEKKEGLHFRLNSKEITAEFRMHTTGGNQWLLERVDMPQTDWLRDPIEPMLAHTAEGPPHKDEYFYEVKWDGVRALVALDDGAVTIRSRNQLDLTSRFPELLIPDRAFRAASALFDAEIVCLDDEGKPVFNDVMHRIQQTSKGAIERAQHRHPAVCYVFDCLYLDGRPVVNETLLRRREWMEDAIRPDSAYRVSEAVEDGAGLFEASVKMGLEGIMAKRKESLYLPGARSSNWLKIKRRQTTECLIVGYTRGKGDRRGFFSALHLAKREGGRLSYVGKVGTGFDEESMEETFAQLKRVRTAERPFSEKPADDPETVWLEPEVICEVQYSSLTRDGKLREPVFLRLRPDLTA